MESHLSVRIGLLCARRAFREVSLCGAVLVCVLGAEAADWPTYRNDNARSGATAENLSFPLASSWTFTPRQAPLPAWPAPARRSYWQRLDRIEPRVTDDHCPHPIVSHGRVFFVASASDRVLCLEAVTGEVRWQFFADAPIRYAPTVVDGRFVLFGSDDGCAYCLNTEEGTLVWRRRVAPTDRRIPGNGRLISVWPVRTGVLVENEVAYCFAGLFPSQGVYAAALNLQHGSLLYRRTLEASPQGYLLSAGQELYVPTGRANPIAVSMATGALLRRYDGVGGSFAVVAEDQVITGRGNTNTLSISHRQAKASLAYFPGRDIVVTSALSYLLGPDELVALDRARFIQLTTELRAVERELNEVNKRAGQADNPAATRTSFARDTERLTARINNLRRQRDDCTKWRVPVHSGLSMILADHVLVVGKTGELAAHDSQTGRQIWSEPVEGRVLGLAAADGRLFAGTDTGSVLCFSTPRQIASGKKAPTHREPKAPSDKNLQDPVEVRSILERISATPAARKGYALLTGSTNPKLAEALARETDLRVQVVVRDGRLAESMRQRFLLRGLYGSRIAVCRLTNDVLPYTDAFANVVIDEASLAGHSPAWAPAELRRVLRPYGSLIWTVAWDRPDIAPPLAGAADWTHLYGNPANTASTADRNLGAKLKLQWFGGPGPNGMVDRHLRGPAPLVANGRAYVAAENLLIGMDAFNGTELWRLPLSNFPRYSIPYDSGCMAADENRVYVAVQQVLWSIDGQTGEVTKRTALPVPTPHSGGKRHWGYVATADDALFGSIQKPTAARQEASRHAIDAAYWSRQPLVTSEAVFRLDLQESQARWSHGKGAIVDTTITLFEDSMFFLESRNEKVLNHPTGRLTLMELTARDLYLVALDSDSGAQRWERELDLRRIENIVYLSAAQGLLVLTGSGIAPNNDARYFVRVFDASNGQERWSATHDHEKPGALGHGEQVHHPVILGDLLVTEPVIYELRTGRPYSPNGTKERWRIERPGHSCGTMSGAGSCLFFRADNPTVLDIRTGRADLQRFQTLAPSRPGCWINMIPANGLLLLPEASAGCVCAYPIQTSMAFRTASALLEK